MTDQRKPTDTHDSVVRLLDGLEQLAGGPEIRAFIDGARTAAELLTTRDESEN